MTKNDVVYAAVKTVHGYRVIPGVVLNTNGYDVTAVQYPLLALAPDSERTTWSNQYGRQTTSDSLAKGYWSPGCGGEPWLWRATAELAVVALREHIIAKHTAAAQRDCAELSKAVDTGPLPEGFVKRQVAYGG